MSAVRPARPSRSTPRAAALALAFALLSAGPAHAETPEERGLAIARQMDAAFNGYQGETSEVEMQLVNAQGDTVTRRMSQRQIEVAGDGDRSVITFNAPPDVAGTRLLTWAHPAGDDDQWLFLPSVKRVKRISARSRSASFMGSEFAYEDLGALEIAKYRHRYDRDEDAEGRPCWVIERVPTDENSGYARQVVFVDRTYLQALRIDYYDRKNVLLKTATFSGHKQFGTAWRPARIEMRNHQTHKSSVLVWSERALGASLSPGDFTAERLEL